jgi:hypothetical protein
MRTDSEIKKHVEEQLRWDPHVDATDVAVAVHRGVATVTGFVRSCMQKTQAERDAKRVAGVMAVANDVEVRLPYINKRPDPEIACDAVQSLQNELPYSSQFVKVTVKDGSLTLEGALEWNYQRVGLPAMLGYLFAGVLVGPLGARCRRPERPAALRRRRCHRLPVLQGVEPREETAGL